MAAQPLPKAEEFRQSYDYCPATGRLLIKPKIVDYTKKRRDVERAIKWNAEKAGTDVGWIDGSTGYRKVGLNYGNYPVHRVIWLLHYGEEPDGEIDHLNGNKSDNKIANLRVVTPSENCRNRRRKLLSKCGIQGVYFSASRRRYVAYAGLKRKRITIGHYKTAEEAEAARLQFVRSNGFTERHLKPHD